MELIIRDPHHQHQDPGSGSQRWIAAMVGVINTCSGCEKGLLSGILALLLKVLFSVQNVIPMKSSSESYGWKHAERITP